MAVRIGFMSALHGFLEDGGYLWGGGGARGGCWPDLEDGRTSGQRPPLSDTEPVAALAIGNAYANHIQTPSAHLDGSRYVVGAGEKKSSLRIPTTNLGVPS